MAQILIDLGTGNNTLDGEGLRDGGVSINANFTELFNNIKPIVSKNANYTPAVTDWTIECTANSFTILLPTSVGITGKVFNVVNSGSGTITIDGNGTETINGVLTQSLSQWDSITIQSNGANWIIL